MNFLKLSLALLSCTLFVTQNYAQTAGTAVFSNGVSIHFIFSESPMKTPKYSFGISPFGPSMESIGFKVNGYINLTDRFSVRVKTHGLYSNFGKRLDRKYPLDILSFGEYKFFDKRINKNQRVTLKSEANTVWVSDIPLQKRRTIGVAGGFAYNSYADGAQFHSLTEFGTINFDDTTYYTTDVGYYGLTLGVTYEASKSYSLRSDKLTKLTCGYKTKRFYAFIIQSIPSVVKTYSDINGKFEVNAPFDYEFSTLYFRLGWEAEYGFNNSIFALLVGAEIGNNPYIRANSDGTLAQGTEPLFHFTLGVSIGQNPWSTK